MWDKLSIMIIIIIIKICSKSLNLPLKLMFHSMLGKGVFSENWEKNKVVPIHKRK